MTICSPDMLLSWFGSSLLFHVQFLLLLPDLHIDFSGGRSGALLFQSLSEFFTVCVVIHTVKGFGVVNKAEVDIFLELFCFFYDPTDIDSYVGGVCNFLGSLITTKIWRDRRTRVAALRWTSVTAQFYLESKEKYTLEVWGWVDPKDAKRRKADGPILAPLFICLSPPH